MNCKCPTTTQSITFCGWTQVNYFILDVFFFFIRFGVCISCCHTCLLERLDPSQDFFHHSQETSTFPHRTLILFFIIPVFLWSPPICTAAYSQLCISLPFMSDHHFVFCSSHLSSSLISPPVWSPSKWNQLSLWPFPPLLLYHPITPASHVIPLSFRKLFLIPPRLLPRCLPSNSLPHAP